MPLAECFGWLSALLENPMPTNRPRSSKSSTRRPRSEEVQSFDFEDTSDLNDFGAGLADDAPAPKATRKPTRKSEPEPEPEAPRTRRPAVKAEAPAAPAPAAEEAPTSRRRRTITGKRVEITPAEDSAPVEETRRDDAPRSRSEDDFDRPSYNDDRDDRAADGDDRIESREDDGGDEGGTRRRRRRRRGRGGRDGDAVSNPRTPAPGRGAAPQGRGPNQGRGSQSGRGPSDRGGHNQGGNRFGGRAPQQSQFEGRRPRGERRSLSAASPRDRIMKDAPAQSEIVGELQSLTGVLELHPKGYGFLRMAKNDYAAEDSDAFVSSSLIEKHRLREGVKIVGDAGMGPRGQGLRLVNVEEIDNRTPEEYEQIKNFDDLTPINPHEQIILETGTQPITMRVMDLLTPIGKGTRALIVAPPRSGKTMLMQDIANSVAENHPEIQLIVLLIDERPEEVTDMRRNVKGEVVASSMDRDVESHVRISQLVFERGKRIAESGKHCLILMDSITRCARAFNKWIGGGRDSKIGTGGLDNRALEIPRRMFGTARRFEEGGSLTVIATALIETGNRMDDSIFLEFKGTGNMELVLSRELAERRIWPAIDASRSGTRREEKILSPEVMEGVTMLRRSLAALHPTEAMETLVKTLSRFPDNKAFLERIKSVL